MGIEAVPALLALEKVKVPVVGAMGLKLPPVPPGVVLPEL
jgi:hypothetical protein